MAWIDGIGQAITAFIGLSNGRVIQTQQFTSELGFGHGIDGLGEVPEHLRQLVEEWQRMPTATRAQDVKREMTQAGRLEGQALMMKGLGDARIKKIKAATSMGKTKLKVDLATFQAGSQLAQAQAQNLDQMASMDWQNQLTGARLSGKVSELRGNETIFNLS